MDIIGHGTTTKKLKKIVWIMSIVELKLFILKVQFNPEKGIKGKNKLNTKLAWWQILFQSYNHFKYEWSKLKDRNYQVE